jgi:nuclease YhcG-like protein
MRRSSASSSKVNIAGAASGAKRLRARGGLLSSAASIKIAGQDYYLDLLFYQPSLRCFAVIELKIEDFKLEFAGSMNFYLSAVDDQLQHNDDQPTIGIILCKGRNDVIVEYALRDSTKPR